MTKKVKDIQKTATELINEVASGLPVEPSHVQVSIDGDIVSVQLLGDDFKPRDLSQNEINFIKGLNVRTKKEE